MTASNGRYTLMAPGRGAHRLTLILMALSGLAVLFLVFVAAIWAATESDSVAQERQRRLVETRLQDQLDRAADEMRLMAAGFSSFLSSGLVAFPHDQEGYGTSAVTFGQIVTTIFRYDAAFVVNAAGDLLLPQDTESAKRYKWVKPLLLPLLEPSSPAHTTKPESNPLKELPRNIALMKLEGRPSIAGAVQIKLPAQSAQWKDTDLHLVVFRFLDGATLDALSKEQGLAGARYSRTADQDANEMAFPVEATVSRNPIGFFIWTPDLPGSQVVGKLVPVLSASGFLIIVLFLALMARLRASLSKLSESEEAARHLSLHDVLTDLPNRALFAQHLERYQQTSLPQDKWSALALLDLDHFKEVNDTFGHAVGDELLKAVVERLTELTQHGHLLARLGGDEFGLLLGSGRTPEAALSFCEALIETIRKPFRLRNDSIIVRIGCSAGIVILDEPGLGNSEALRRADVALYVAKNQGKARAIAYDSAFDAGLVEREHLKSDIREAFELRFGDDGEDITAPPDSFKVFYQSIHYGDTSQTLWGAEALVRWEHPHKGYIAPDVFLPLIEELGLIDRLGRWVLGTAIDTAAKWPSAMRVSVNVSPSQLKNPRFADDVLSLLKSSRFEPDRLELELTEAALFQADDSAKRELSRLRAKGVHIALDDFGTGYSSLSHLLQFNIDRIKIDRSFVQLLGTKAEGAAIVSAILAMSKNLGTATTAEGVETEGQRDFLVAAGTSNLQGYLFSKAMPEDEFVHFINTHRKLQFGHAARQDR